MTFPNFAARYPLASALGISPVAAGDAGFDEQDVEAKLGPVRFAALSKAAVSVFSCGHRKYPAGHTKAQVVDEHGKPVDLGGYEVHCFYAKDVESFLSKGG